MSTSTKTNKDIILDKVTKLGYELGCYNNDIDKLSKEQMKKVLEAVSFEDTTDIIVPIRRKKYVVEIAVVDNEIDLNIKSLEEYIDLYGDEILEE